jgi:Abortive infection alpha
MGADADEVKGIDEAAGKALGPSAEAFGKEIVPLGQRAGQLTNRVGVLLIRALEPLVYGLEKSGNWIEKAVTERLKNIPPEKVVPPNPRIAAPAMQSLIYSMHDEPIRDMFANLLAADMNADTKADAHPAFVEFIKEMTPADAKVLATFRQSPWQCSFEAQIGAPGRYVSYGPHFSFSIAGLSDDDIGKSLNNLDRLGLVERRDAAPVFKHVQDIEAALTRDYEPKRQAYDNAEWRKHFDLPADKRIELNVVPRGLYLSPLGTSFTRICLG